MNPENGEPAALEGGLSGFLEPNEISGGVGVDIALVRRAVKGRWPMKPEVRTQIMQRLGEIVARSSVVIPGEEGGLNEAIADRNSIGAANVLRLMIEEDRAAEFKAAGHLLAVRAQNEGSKTTVNSTVRMLVVDATGREQPVNGLREYYNRFPAGDSPKPLPASTAAPEPPEQTQGGDGGQARG